MSLEGSPTRHAISGSKDAGLFGSAALLVASLLVVSASVFRGGNRWLPLTVLEWLGLALLVLLAVGWQARNEPVGKTQRVRRWVLAMVMSSPLWIAALQWVAWPGSVWDALPGRQLVLGGAGEGMSGRISLLPDETWRSALASLPVLACFALGLFAPARWLPLLIRVWLATAVFQAALGLLQLGIPALAFSDTALNAARGSFGSQNSLANYIAMVLPLALLLAMHGDPSARGSRRSAGQGQWRWWAAMLLLLAGLIASASRAGIASGVLVVLLAWTLFPRSLGRGSGHGGHQALRGWTRLLPLALLLFAMASGGWRWLERFEHGSPSRLLNWAATWDGVEAFWPIGSGLGTFAPVFPLFQPPELGRWLVNFAHNDYLQLLMECGVLVMPVAFGLVWLIGRRTVQLVKASRLRAMSSADVWALACGLGFLAQALHAWVDYPWHIPATAMLGAFLLGVFLREPQGISSARQAA